MTVKDLPIIWIRDEYNNSKKNLKTAELHNDHWKNVSTFQGYLDMRKELVEVTKKYLDKVSK